jgi:hypothetical protein
MVGYGKTVYSSLSRVADVPLNSVRSSSLDVGLSLILDRFMFALSLWAFALCSPYVSSLGVRSLFALHSLLFTKGYRDGSA